MNQEIFEAYLTERENINAAICMTAVMKNPVTFRPMRVEMYCCIVDWVKASAPRKTASRLNWSSFNFPIAAITVSVLLLRHKQCNKLQLID